MSDHISPSHQARELEPEYANYVAAQLLAHSAQPHVTSEPDEPDDYVHPPAAKTPEPNDVDMTQAPPLAPPHSPTTQPPTQAPPLNNDTTQKEMTGSTPTGNAPPGDAPESQKTSAQDPSAPIISTDRNTPAPESAPTTGIPCRSILQARSLINNGLGVREIVAQKRAQHWARSKQTSAGGAPANPINVDEETPIKKEPQESVFSTGFSWNPSAGSSDKDAIIIDDDDEPVAPATDPGSRRSAGFKRSHEETADNGGREATPDFKATIESLLANPTIDPSQRMLLQTLLAQKQEETAPKSSKSATKRVRLSKDGDSPQTAREIRKAEASKKRRKTGTNGVNQTTGQIIGDTDYTTGAIEARQAQGEEYDNLDLHLTGDRAQTIRQMLESISKTSQSDARKQGSALSKAAKRFGKNKVRVAKDNTGMKWTLKGLKFPLYNHQMMGVNWMLDREVSGLPSPGGILADAMGIGKTIQTLATMMYNKPVLADGDKRATLIVVRPSILDQWVREIERHAGRNLGHIGVFTRKSRLLPIQWADYDVIMATYADVAISYPFPDKDERKGLSYKMVQAWSAEHMHEAGVLHQMEFYRVVLDEAHAIKNYLTHTSQACVALKGQIKWALSGTPLLNCLEETYAYLKFIGADMGMTYKSFKHTFAKKDDTEGPVRLQTLLSSVMIRRHMKDMMMGLPLVSLPMAHSTMIQVEFSPAERILYDALEDLFIGRLNEDIKNKVAQYNVANYMVMLMRLRQMTGHSFLLQGTLQQYFDEEVYENLNNRLKAEAGLEMEQIDEEEDEPVQVEKTMLDYLGEIAAKSCHDPTECYTCADEPRTPIITTCEHVFCEDCFQELNPPEEHDLKKFCPACDSDCEARRISKFQLGLLKKARQDTKKPQKPWISFQDSLRQVTSAKTQAVTQIISEWKHSHPNDKIVIYSQFLMLLDIVGELCVMNGWSALKFNGKMDAGERAEQVALFEKEADFTIMLCSLRAGGEGLNLNVANRVISLDPWWNVAAEDQAFGRVFRIGQNKETHMHRVVVKDTVDRRILELQELKRRRISQVIREDGQELKPLSLREISKLFGKVITDENNNVLRIEPDRGSEEPLVVEDEQE